MTLFVALFEASETLSQVFSEFSYTGPFLVLVLCGIGLPLPEEVTLIGAGILCYRGEVEFWPIVVVCSVAILIGDSGPFLLGRRYGKSALRVPWVAKILHPERFARLERRFAAHGSWAVFLCRFVAGIRVPGYFVAGTMRMSFLRFAALDALGVALTVPISIYLGRLFGGHVDRLHSTMADFHLILAFLLLSVLLVVVVRFRRSRTERSGEAQGPTEDG